MTELLEEGLGLESTTISIYRTASTVKGGRRFSFGALVAVGDRNGSVGLGYAKAPGVPAAIEKAQKAAKKAMVRINLQQGTIPHEVNARYLASGVKLVPASPGTGVIAGGTVRAVLELAGVRDCLTKAIGSTNQKNLAKAAMAGLQSMRTKEKVEQLRGVTLGKTIVDQKLEQGAGSVQMPNRPARAPQKRDERKGRGGGGKGRPSGGGGRGRGRGGDRPAGSDAGPSAPASP